MLLVLVGVSDLPARTGFTRKAIGATFEGETKESDGIVFADVEAEGITTTDVSISTALR